MFRNRDRFVRIVIWVVVFTMILSVLAVLASVL
jgi:hypothetical protein